MEKSKQISNKELKKKEKERKIGLGDMKTKEDQAEVPGETCMCELTLSLAKSESITFCVFVSNSDPYFHLAIYCADL